MKEVVNRLNDGGRFVSVWELFAQIEEAEIAHGGEGARYLVSSLECDPTGINYIRRRHDSGIVSSLDLGARLHLLGQLSIFASQGTLFDVDDMPTDEAQATFERFGFYASDIYPFLTRNDIAVSRPGDDGSEDRVFPDGRSVPGWIIAYDHHPWLSRSRVAKTLIAGTDDAALRPPQYDDVYWKWDEALSDAIERGSIAVMEISRKQMLAHVDVRAWCAQHGYVWPLGASEAQQADRLDVTPVSDAQVQSEISATRSLRFSDIGSTKRERQIRAIEEMADKLGYSRQQIPDGGKTELRKLCKSQYSDLFGGGDSPFDDAWKVAAKANRIAMANRNKFAGR